MATQPTLEEVRRDRAAFWKEMTPYVTEAVTQSFSSNGMAVFKRREVTHRLDMAMNIVKKLRYELRWSKFRIRDSIGTLLRAKIAGIEVDLNAMTMKPSWSAPV